MSGSSRSLPPFTGGVARRAEGGILESPPPVGFADASPVNGGGETFKVGPNAVTQLAAAIEARCGSAMADAVFAAGNVYPYRIDPPHAMIPQDVAIAAHKALFKLMRPHEAEALAYDAGVRTADYLLRHRIPRMAQSILKRLPRRWAASLLIAAIGKHAWTFAGSGMFSARRNRDVVIVEIVHNPLAMNPCEWHRGVFERLFRTLINPAARVTETQCTAAGAESCRFEIELKP